MPIAGKRNISEPIKEIAFIIENRIGFGFSCKNLRIPTSNKIPSDEFLTINPIVKNTIIDMIKSILFRLLLFIIHLKINIKDSKFCYPLIDYLLFLAGAI